MASEKVIKRAREARREKEIEKESLLTSRRFIAGPAFLTCSNW